MDRSFGNFIESKRKVVGITLRQMAERMSITPSYLSDIEKGRRYAPDKEKLDEIVTILGLDEKETEEMYDLAGKTKEEIPPDIPDYLMEKDLAVTFLRTAKKKQLTDTQWKDLIRKLNEDR